MHELDSIQIAALHERLLTLKEELQLSLASQKSAKAAAKDTAGSSNLRAAIEKALLPRLRSIDIAISKFERNGYGICAVCGETIDYSMLSIAPDTPYCRGCQAALVRES